MQRFAPSGQAQAILSTHATYRSGFEPAAVRGDAADAQLYVLFAGARAANLTPSSKNSPAWSPR
jgi:hypothetical protein